MKNVVGVFWHGQYNLLCTAREDLKGIVNLSLYSSRLLDGGGQKMEDLFRDFSAADLILLYTGVEDNCWAEIEAHIAGLLGIPVIYLGGDGATKIKTEDDLCAASICNTYLTYSGKSNFVNFFKYITRVKTGAELDYREPEFVPWEGIFHPDTEEVFYSLEDYFAWRPPSGRGVIALVTSRSYWLNDNIQPEIETIRGVEERGFSVVPVYSYSLKDSETGALGMAHAVERFLFDKNGVPVPDALIKFSSFFFESESRQTREKRAWSGALLKKLGCPILKPIVSNSMTVEEWRESESGTVKDIAWSIALPELEGVIEPLFIGGVKNIDGIDVRQPVKSRVDKMVERALRWARLRKKPNSEKKLVFVLNNNPCASVEATVGGASNLDALESVAQILKRLKDEGYTIENPPANSGELIANIMEHKAISEFRWTTVKEIVEKGGALAQIGADEYEKWFATLPEKARQKVTDTWGRAPGEEKDGVPAAMLHEGKIVVTGLRFGNALVCVQPKRGCAGPRCDGTVCKILHDPAVPPTHQYLATYQYFEHDFKADALIHVGTHGNLEFLPGKGTGLSDDCFPDICAGNIPCLYLYNADNPPEGTIAKRRGLAVIIDHLQTTLTASGVYDSLEELDTLLAQYDRVSIADRQQAHLLEHQIKEAIEASNLNTQIDLDNYHERFAEITAEAHRILGLVKNSRIQDGLHIIGQIPQGEGEVDFINSIVRYEGPDKKSLRSAAAKLIGVELKDLLAESGALSPRYQKNNGSILFDLDIIVKEVLRRFFEGRAADETIDLLDYALVDKSALDALNAERDRVLDIRARLGASKEIDALLSGLRGEYIPAGPAGAITRGRDDVLPTGRNFFTLDPESIPTRAAYEVGKRLAERVIEKFMEEEGRYPENFSMYWMCNDIMWADGEGMGQALYLIGARPLWLPNGRVSGFSVIPLAELGRPRIDITVKLSGILRDNFEDRVSLLDGAVQAVAALDEDPEQNYVRKHSLSNMADDPALTFEEASRRIFGSKPGTYVTGVSLAVYASSWKDGKDFLDLFTYFNGYSYGKSGYGAEAYRQLQNNLRTVDITYNKVISDEHDLLGCCCYFGNHGGMTAAAKELSGKNVKTYYGDTREVSRVDVRTLAEELRRVVRTRLLNPKWIDGQKRHGYTGAMNISKRVGRVYGWEATTEEVDDWIFDDITKTFIANEENRQFFMENNPWALEEMSRRLIEAYERKLWQPAEGMIEEIKNTYLEIEGFMEESMGDNPGNFQGGAIDIIDLNELENYRESTRKMREALG
jgi:cobaltochelatase CobN